MESIAVAVAAAYPRVKAVFKDVNSIDPDILFDVVLWDGAGGGRIVVPGSVKLLEPPHAPVPSNYVFTGYGYCP